VDGAGVEFGIRYAECRSYINRDIVNVFSVVSLTDMLSFAS
jgi:hypothetical protein